MSDTHSGEVDQEADEVSQRWKCGECGGDVKLVEHTSTPASATESFDCVECGESVDVLFAEGPQYPRKYGSVVPK